MEGGAWPGSLVRGVWTDVFVWRLCEVALAMLAAFGVKRGVVEEIDPALQALAAELRAALQPVVPPAAFRTQLARGLATAGRQRRAVRIVVQQPRDHWRGLLIGAAAVSSAVSVAGVVALIRRHRSRQVAPTTP